MLIFHLLYLFRATKSNHLAKNNDETQKNLVVNSQLISFSFGTLKSKLHPHQNFRHLVDLKNKKSNVVPFLRALPDENRSRRLSVPIKIHLKHKKEHVTNDAYSICALWNSKKHNWDTHDCGLVMSNESHSICACRKLGTYALLVDRAFLESNFGEERNLYSSTVIIIIVSSSILVLLFILLIAVGFVYYRSLKVNTQKCCSCISILYM